MMLNFCQTLVAPYLLFIDTISAIVHLSGQMGIVRLTVLADCC